MAELISGPLMSLVLVILAGIALRYALGSLQERLPAEPGRIKELDERVASLSAALDKALRDGSVAQANFDRAVEDYELLKRSLVEREIEWTSRGESSRADDDASTESWSATHDRDNSAHDERQRWLEMQLQESLATIERLQDELQHTQALSDTRADELQQQLAQALSDRQMQVGEKLALMQVEKEELARGMLREQETARQAVQQAEADAQRAAQLEAELGDFNALYQQHQSTLVELDDLRQSYDLTCHKFSATERLVGSLQEKMTTLQTRVDGAERELMAERTQVTNLRHEQQERLTTLHNVESENRALQNLLDVHAETMQRMIADSLSIEALWERHASVQSSLRAHASHLQSVAASLRDETQTEILNFTAVEGKAAVLPCAEKRSA